MVDEVLHSDFVCWDPNSETGEIRGAQTIKGEIAYFRNAVPDLTYAVEDQIAEGDKVVTRHTARGAHQGEFFGVADTGKRMEMSGISIDRFEEGKLVEEWPGYDLLGAMRQVGAIPDSEQAASSQRRFHKLLRVRSWCSHGPGLLRLAHPEVSVGLGESQEPSV